MSLPPTRSAAKWVIRGSPCYLCQGGHWRAKRRAYSSELQFLTGQTFSSVFEDAVFLFQSTFFKALSHCKQVKDLPPVCTFFVSFQFYELAIEQTLNSLALITLQICSLRALLAPVFLFFGTGHCAFIVRPPTDILDPAGCCDRTLNSWERYPTFREGPGKGQGQGGADVGDLNAGGSSSAGPQLLPSPSLPPPAFWQSLCLPRPFQTHHRANHTPSFHQVCRRSPLKLLPGVWTSFRIPWWVPPQSVFPPLISTSNGSESVVLVWRSRAVSRDMVIEMFLTDPFPR